MLPAFKTSLKWVAARLAIDLPDLDDRRLRALQESVIAKRAKTLKEALPIPIEVVGLLEVFVCDVLEARSIQTVRMVDPMYDLRIPSV